MKILATIPDSQINLITSSLHSLFHQIEKESNLKKQESTYSTSLINSEREKLIQYLPYRIKNLSFIFASLVTIFEFYGSHPNLIPQAIHIFNISHSTFRNCSVYFL